MNVRKIPYTIASRHDCTLAGYCCDIAVIQSCTVQLVAHCNTAAAVTAVAVNAQLPPPHWRPSFPFPPLPSLLLLLSSSFFNPLLSFSPPLFALSFTSHPSALPAPSAFARWRYRQLPCSWMRGFGLPAVTVRGLPVPRSRFRDGGSVDHVWPRTPRYDAAVCAATLSAAVLGGGARDPTCLLPCSRLPASALHLQTFMGHPLPASDPLTGFLVCGGRHNPDSSPQARSASLARPNATLAQSPDSARAETLIQLDSPQLNPDCMEGRLCWLLSRHSGEAEETLPAKGQHR